MKTLSRLPVLLLLAVGGCVGNPYKEFYLDAPDANTVLERRASAAQEHVELYQHTADIMADARSMRERGLESE